ncbi:DUF1836 domain-containing protein [Christensenellaceae bacterium OttesenSCG-928-K19]|nr:DUF1836 domain-containing protein [Christensenellaceae bacterium OttesenSCG-928-K19]
MDYLPGTTVEVNENNTAQGFLDSAFAMGGLVLSQVVQLTGLEPHTVQNWVKRKFISPPVHKKYDCRQFCRIALINMLKDILQIERIIAMLRYVYRSEGEADDIMIYTTFSSVMAAVPKDAIREQTNVDEIISEEVQKKNLSADVSERLKEVIKVMVLAFISARVKKRAELFLVGIEQKM